MKRLLYILVICLFIFPIITNAEEKYTVTWKNWKGTIIETDFDVEAGTIPTYDGDLEALNRDRDDTYLYQFNGWDKPLDPVTEDVEFTTTYKKTMYHTITYKPNGGTGDDMPIQICVSKVQCSIYSNEYGKNEYELKEWNTKPDGSGTSYQPYDKVEVTENITLYAIWKKIQFIQDGNYYIYSVINDKFCVDLSGGKVVNKRNIHLYEGNLSTAQIWNVKYLGDGVYRISSGKNNNFVLDVAGGKTKKGTNVQLYKSNGTDAQKWVIKPTGTARGVYTILSKKSNLALDVSGGKAVNKKNIQIYTNNNTKAQQFIFTPVVTPNGEGIGNGVYRISMVSNYNPKSQYSIDLTDGKIANKTNIRMNKYYNSNNQSWFIERLNNGFYRIRLNMNRNFCLDLQDGSKIPGANIQLWLCGNNNINQQFKITRFYSSHASGYAIYSRINGLALSPYNGFRGDYNNYNLYTLPFNIYMNRHLFSIYRTR